MSEDEWNGSISPEGRRSVWDPRRPEIRDFNNISISTVKKISKLYNDFLASGGKDEDFDIERKAHSRRSDTQRDNMVELVQDMVDVDHGVSMRAMAREVGCSDWLVRTIVKEDLRYKSYRLGNMTI